MNSWVTWVPIASQQHRAYGHEFIAKRPNHYSMNVFKSAFTKLSIILSYDITTDERLKLSFVYHHQHTATLEHYKTCNIWSPLPLGIKH